MSPLLAIVQGMPIGTLFPATAPGSTSMVLADNPRGWISAEFGATLGMQANSSPKKKTSPALDIHFVRAKGNVRIPDT